MYFLLLKADRRLNCGSKQHLPWWDVTTCKVFPHLPNPRNARYKREISDTSCPGKNITCAFCCLTTTLIEVHHCHKMTIDKIIQKYSLHYWYSCFTLIKITKEIIICRPSHLRSDRRRAAWGRTCLGRRRRRCCGRTPWARPSAAPGPSAAAAQSSPSARGPSSSARDAAPSWWRGTREGSAKCAITLWVI